MAPPPKLNANEEEALVEDYENGASVDSLCKRFGISAGTVRNIVRRHGGELRPVGRPVAAR